MRPNPSLNTLQNISSSDDDYYPDQEFNWGKNIENAFHQNYEIKGKPQEMKLLSRKGLNS